MNGLVLTPGLGTLLFLGLLPLGCGDGEKDEGVGGAGTTVGAGGTGGSTGAVGTAGGNAGGSDASNAGSGTGGLGTNSGGTAPSTGGATASSGGLGTDAGGSSTNAGGASTSAGGSSTSAGGAPEPVDLGLTDTHCNADKEHYKAGNACTAGEGCFERCGPDGTGRGTGVKGLKCEGGVFATVPCFFDPANDYSCYKLPTPPPACPAGTQRGGVCEVEKCAPCGSATDPNAFLTAGGNPHAGFCLCLGAVWSCEGADVYPCLVSETLPGCR